MANVLLLVHRIPYPPNKGDKLRSYHLLRALAERHRVFLGTLVDDPADMAHVQTLRTWCADVCAVPLQPIAARLRCLAGLLANEPLTLRYFASARLERWVRAVMSTQGIDRIVAFSSSMAPYAMAHPAVPLWMDFVDVDSAKWAAYAQTHRGLMRVVYGREARLLARYEARVGQHAEVSSFATSAEAALFPGPRPGLRLVVVENGVDTGHYAPDANCPSPFAPGELPVVFTGTMDHWPNVDAACWFAQQVLPLLRRRHPACRFHVVGRRPSRAVQRLARRDAAGVAVTGAVEDVRPYLQHAAVVVAPMRVARGVQNKVLEALAMARPVVATPQAAAGVGNGSGDEFTLARDAADFAAAVDHLLSHPAAGAAIGAAGRSLMLRRFQWRDRWRPLEHWLAVPALAVQSVAPSPLSITHAQ